MSARIASAQEVALAVHEAIARGDGIASALETALAGLKEQERLAISLLRTGQVKGQTAALVAAGYSAGYARVPRRVFGRLAVAVAVELARLLDEGTSEVSSESYRDDLVKLAHADPSDAFDENGRLLRLAEWPKPLRRMVKRLKFDPVLGTVTEVVFDGRAQLMALLGKHKLVGAFDQVKTQTRTFVIRDYTGQSAPASLPAAIPQSPPSDAMEAEVIESEPDLEELDRGSIPVP